MKSVFSIAAALVAGLVASNICLAASYSYTDLGGFSYTIPIGGGIQATGTTNGYAINASGQVVGQAQYGSSSNNTHVDDAFLYDGNLHDLGNLGGPSPSSLGTAINDLGRIAGYASFGDGTSHAFLYDGTMHDLGTIDGLPSSEGLGINNAGMVVGYAIDSSAHSRAFVYDGTMHDLGTLGGANSAAWAINASGQVTGGATIAGDTELHAFLYDGTMHDLGTLQAGWTSEALGINASGVVVGDSYLNNNQVTSSSYHALVYDSAHGMRDLNSLVDPSLGLHLSKATGINDAGQITGYTSNGHAFILTPVPEPSTLVLAALAAVGLAAFARPRRSQSVARAGEG